MPSFTHTPTRRRVLTALSALVVSVATLVGFTGQANAVTTNPTPWTLRTPGWFEDSNFARALITSFWSPSKDPIGANDWGCRPSAAHPEPVILIHGTWENAYDNWNGLSPILKAQGYCVFAVNYGNTGYRAVNATGDMIASANQIAAFVNRVVSYTGAKHVALVGHSQGSAQARYVANLLLPAGLVTKVIAITATNHQTTLSGITSLGNMLGLTGIGFSVLNGIRMPSAVQQAVGSYSPFYTNLNGKGETRPGIAYTNIETRYDEVATPYTVGFLTAGPGATVDNILIQNICSSDYSEHVALSYSKNVAQVVLNKLDPDHPHAIRCYYQTI
ncbi:MAG: lipase family protein, partial [Actinomycetia bacterium]|nr:lipase family protein [Actinomycetes bacterium]